MSTLLVYMTIYIMTKHDTKFQSYITIGRKIYMTHNPDNAIHLITSIDVFTAILISP